MKGIILILILLGVIVATEGIVSIEGYKVFTGIAPLAGMAIGAGLSAAGSAVGTQMQGAVGRESQRRQNKYNLGMMAEQNRYTKELMGLQQQYGKEMFDYTYDKQKYSSQVNEMRNAGLNIGLMYGGIGGLQGTTGTTSGSSSAGSVSGYSASSDMGMAIGAGANLMADVKLKEAQANNLNADTENKKGVVVDEAKARIEQLKQLTDNEKVQEAILQYERQLKAIETDVQRRTADDRVKAVNLANEQLQKVITGEGLSNALKEGVLEDLIKQANQTTFEQKLRMQGIDLNNETMKRRIEMLSTELTLTKEQINRLKAMSQHEQNEEIMRMKEISIKKLEQEFKTSNTQEVKLWNDMANGWANTILNAIR